MNLYYGKYIFQLSFSIVFSCSMCLLSMFMYYVHDSSRFVCECWFCSSLGVVCYNSIWKQRHVVWANHIYHWLCYSGFLENIEDNHLRARNIFLDTLYKYQCKRPGNDYPKGQMLETKNQTKLWNIPVKDNQAINLFKFTFIFNIDLMYLIRLHVEITKCAFFFSVLSCCHQTLSSEAVELERSSSN